jgi:tricorn protease
MNGIDWREMHKRYKPLVKRCAKREELDDILEQMAAVLSALHVFVYGGEYPDPLHDDNKLKAINEIASLGATLDRSAEWKGYVVSSIPERDPDFNLLDGKPVYSPLSDKVLSLTGQRGLQVGDVIVGINGESVMRVPDIHMLLRGKAKESVRLDVLRLASGSSQSSTSGRRRVDDNDNGHMENNDETPAMRPEPVITVPLTPMDAETLLYQAWEWKTRQMATALAARHNFTVGYLHLQSMEEDDADAFARGFYPNYNKDALIVDVRHNHGGNIDSWLLDVLQRQAWMYWQGRATNIDNGGLGWDEQFAFRGHLVVLVDEKTSSDGEGFSRGVLELGLGVLIGRRTWGGGIWLSSDNHLVDGGIATAPEIGTYNDKFGWGLGIENMGVEPDVDVDNNPRRFYDGQDEQLEKAIQYLADWLKKEPIVRPKDPGPKKDMSLPKEARNCPA